jgi:hypothetical protein
MDFSTGEGRRVKGMRVGGEDDGGKVDSTERERIKR